MYCGSELRCNAKLKSRVVGGRHWAGDGQTLCYIPKVAVPKLMGEQGVVLMMVLESQNTDIMSRDAQAV